MLCRVNRTSWGLLISASVWLSSLLLAVSPSAADPPACNGQVPETEESNFTACADMFDVCPEDIINCADEEDLACDRGGSWATWQEVKKVPSTCKTPTGGGNHRCVNSKDCGTFDPPVGLPCLITYYCLFDPDNPACRSSKLYMKGSTNTLLWKTDCLPCTKSES